MGTLISIVIIAGLAYCILGAGLYLFFVFLGDEEYNTREFIDCIFMWLWK